LKGGICGKTGFAVFDQTSSSTATRCKNTQPKANPYGKNRLGQKQESSQKSKSKKRWLRKSKGEGKKPNEKGTSENQEQNPAKPTQSSKKDIIQSLSTN
jgi:hypothetical protein